MMRNPMWRRLGINLGGQKLKRRALLLPTLVLPRAQRTAWFGWAKGRHEFQKLQLADAVVVSFPHSGRTWLRAMLTRYYHVKYELEELRLIGLNRPHKLDRRVPKLFFTHDNYIYSGHHDSKVDFYDKRVVLLVRDPRDTAVSAYHSFRHRPNPTRFRLHRVDPDAPEGGDPFDYIRGRVIRSIDFMNAWELEAARIGQLLRVRYEDLRAAPAAHLRPVLELLGAEPTAAEVADAVDFADFDNMQKLEREGGFGDDHRIAPRQSDAEQSYKVRRGKVGGYRQELTADQAADLDQLVVTRLSPAYGYTAAAVTAGEAVAALAP